MAISLGNGHSLVTGMLVQEPVGAHVPHPNCKILKAVLGTPRCPLKGLRCSQMKNWWNGCFLTLFPKLIDKKQENSLKMTFLGIICILCGTPYENPSEGPSMGQN